MNRQADISSPEIEWMQRCGHGVRCSSRWWGEHGADGGEWSLAAAENGAGGVAALRGGGERLL